MGPRLRLARHAMSCASILAVLQRLRFTVPPKQITVQLRVKVCTRPRTTSSHEVKCFSCSFKGPSWKYSMRSSAPLFFCLCGIVVHGASVDPRAMAPWRQAVLQTETTLRKDCGEECVKVELAMGCGMRPGHVASSRFCTTCWLHQSCTTQRRAVNYNTI